MIHDNLIWRSQAIRARAQRAHAEARQLRNQYEALQAAMTVVEREERAPAPVEQPARSEAQAKALVTLAAE
jgi:hypothetical protein